MSGQLCMRMRSPGPDHGHDVAVQRPKVRRARFNEALEYCSYCCVVVVSISRAAGAASFAFRAGSVPVIDLPCDVKSR